jgi:hypothetical protein
LLPLGSNVAYVELIVDLQPIILYRNAKRNFTISIVYDNKQSIAASLRRRVSKGLLWRKKHHMTENQIATHILDACFIIHRKLGPGLFESVYEEILSYELSLMNL